MKRGVGVGSWAGEGWDCNSSGHLTVGFQNSFNVEVERLERKKKIFFFFFFFLLLQIVKEGRLQEANLEDGGDVVEGPRGVQEEEDLLEL